MIAEFAVPVYAGWNWIGLPATRSLDLQEMLVRVGNTTMSSVADDQQSSPWVNWNWVWWDPIDRTARIARRYTAAYPMADDTSIHPWYGYRVWVNVPEATLIFPAR